VVTPAKTPDGIVAKLNTQLNTAVGLPDVSVRMRDLGMIPVGKGTPDELASFLKAEFVRWAKIVEAAGLAKSQ